MSHGEFIHQAQEHCVRLRTSAVGDRVPCAHAGSLAVAAPAWAQALPLTAAQTPDWSQISFSQFPPVASSGSVPTQGSFPGRRWLAGQTPDQFLALGDVQALQPQAFSLNQIGQVLGQALAQTSLKNGNIP